MLSSRWYQTKMSFDTLGFCIKPLIYIHFSVFGNSAIMFTVLMELDLANNHVTIHLTYFRYVHFSSVHGNRELIRQTQVEINELYSLL